MTTTAIHKVWRLAVPGLLGAIGLTLVTFICFRLQVGLATSVLLYLMAVVLMSLKGSFVASTVVSVLAVGCLDYFFTAPLFTLRMNDVQSYLAMIVFLSISLTITRLVSRVRKHAEEALSSVSHKVIKAEEQECHRIAADLHEDIGQRLTLLALGIEQLKTDTLDPSVDVTSHMDAVSTEISLCLFRVLQEALRNAVQHSGVQQVDARLWGTSDEIQLRVSDLGVGLNLGTAMEVGGLGLNRMQERLKLVKGKLSIDSRPKHGTTIWACVPLSLGSDSMRLVGQSS